jgi:hypothetical protein
MKYMQIKIRMVTKPLKDWQSPVLHNAVSDRDTNDGLIRHNIVLDQPDRAIVGTAVE